MAHLCAFIEKYKKLNYEIEAVDINIEAYIQPTSPIDINMYPSIMEDRIKRGKYDVLCLSAMFAYNHRWVEMAVGLSRKYHPKARIILGGGYATIFPEKCLLEHDLDGVVIGEGDDTLLHILNKYNHFVDKELEQMFPFNGYAFRSGDGRTIEILKRCHYIKMNDLPMPEWHFLNLDKYFVNSGNRVLPILASRGCPYSCTYCSSHLTWGKRVRYKSATDIINEIVSLYNDFKIDGIHFVDDNVTFSKSWIIDFLKSFLSLNFKLTLSLANFSVKHLDAEIIDLFLKAGITYFNISIESGSENIQNAIKKNLDFDKVRSVVNLLRSKHCEVHIAWMVGFPNESLVEINQTFDLARELKADKSIFAIVLPYPETELYRETQKLGLLSSGIDNIDNFDYRKSCGIVSTEWDYDLLSNMVYDINIELNFLNNSLLSTREGREKLLKRLEELVLALPEHVIAHIVLGYLYMEHGFSKNAQKQYDSAIALLKMTELAAVFDKYLAYNHYIINDFNNYKTINITTSTD